MTNDIVIFYGCVTSGSLHSEFWEFTEDTESES